MPLFKYVNGERLVMSPEEEAQTLAEQEAFEQERLNSPAAINSVLEPAFVNLLPAHLGQPYLTDELIIGIGSLKQVVTDYNRLGLYELTKAMIAGIDLPAEMEASRQALLALYPED